MKPAQFSYEAPTSVAEHSLRSRRAARQRKLSRADKALRR